MNDDTEGEAPRAEARIIIRQSVPGTAAALPLLVVDRCPFAFFQPPGRMHAHVHTLCDPHPPPWRKTPPCCRQDYLVYPEAAA